MPAGPLRQNSTLISSPHTSLSHVLPWLSLEVPLEPPFRRSSDLQCCSLAFSIATHTLKQQQASEQAASPETSTSQKVLSIDIRNDPSDEVASPSVWKAHKQIYAAILVSDPDYNQLSH